MTPLRKDRAITVRITKDSEDVETSAPKLRKLIRAVCGRFGMFDAPHVKYDVSLTVVDDAHIRKLNRRFLSHNTTTDCLSFDLSEQDKPKTGASSSRVFEIIVNGQMAARQAMRRGHSAEAELVLYITHGLLHQLGFDDATDQAARKMHRAEDDILEQLGYGRIYNKGS